MTRYLDCVCLCASTGFELLGAISTNKPSGVFSTGWGQHEGILSMIRSFSGGDGNNNNEKKKDDDHITVTLGVSIEPVTNVTNLNIENKGVEDRMDVAKSIAMDLFNYLQSFDDVGSAKNGMMTVLNEVFERWIKRFENKFRLDPNFFLKNNRE